MACSGSRNLNPILHAVASRALRHSSGIRFRVYSLLQQGTSLLNESLKLSSESTVAAPVAQLYAKYSITIQHGIFHVAMSKARCNSQDLFMRRDHGFYVLRYL